MGLRRHQIENLILRGPIFYWRTRIPVGFRAAGRNARLSLSLRLSDRKKASVVARRLNALLLQIEMVPKAKMATREQLTRIFALEAEAIREEIEALDLSAKRAGTLRDPEHREADRQVGWAFASYTLLLPSNFPCPEQRSESHSRRSQISRLTCEGPVSDSDIKRARSRSIAKSSFRRGSGVSIGSTKQRVRVATPALSRIGAAMHQVKRSASPNVSLKPSRRALATSARKSPSEMTRPSGSR